MTDLLDSSLTKFNPYLIQLNSFRSNGETKLPSSKLQYLWWSFLVEPSVDKCIENIKNIKYPNNKLLKKFLTNIHKETIVFDDHNKEDEYNQWKSFYILYIVSSTKKLTENERILWIKRVLPSVNIEELSAFIYHRKAFNKYIWGFMEKRFKLNIPISIPLIVYDTDSVNSHILNYDKIIIQLKSYLETTNGILRIIIDNFLFANVISIGQLYLLSYILLLLKELKYNLNEIIIIDESYYSNEEISLLPFINLYIKSIEKETNAIIKIAYTKIPLYSLNDKDTNIIDSFKKYYMYPCDTEEGIKLDTLIDTNFIKEIHHIKLAIKEKAIYFTIDKKHFYYSIWEKKYNPTNLFYSIYLNVIQHKRDIQWIEQTIC